MKVTDPEGDRITSARIYDFPSHGSINLSFGSELRVVYQPWISEAELCRAVQDRDVLVDEFTVVVEDVCGAKAKIPATVTITVVKLPPALTVPKDVTVGCHEFTHPDDTGWTTATDNYTLAPAVSCTPSGGMFQVGTTTLASITCIAIDACGNSTTDCTFLVTVEFVNRPPVARDDSADCDGTVFIPVLANNYDPDGHPLRIEFVSAPTCGTPPGPGVKDSFTYTITDDYGGFATATVHITITCVICPMVAPPGPTP